MSSFTAIELPVTGIAADWTAVFSFEAEGETYVRYEGDLPGNVVIFNVLNEPPFEPTPESDAVLAPLNPSWWTSPPP